MSKHSCGPKNPCSPTRQAAAYRGPLGFGTCAGYLCLRVVCRSRGEVPQSLVCRPTTQPSLGLRAACEGPVQKGVSRRHHIHQMYQFNTYTMQNIIIT